MTQQLRRTFLLWTAAAGTRWEYGMSTDLLGRVVEVASGMEFGQFVATRILQPLKMNDSGFTITDPEKLQRLAEPQVNPATGKRMDTWPVRDVPRWAPGGHGLVSTANDYARFCQMLLNGGTLDGVRLVSPATVALMARDHLPPGARITAGVAPATNIQVPSVDNGYGFGARLRRAHGRGQQGDPRLGRRPHLVRRLGHVLLDRPEGAAGRDVPDAVAGPADRPVQDAHAPAGLRRPPVMRPSARG